jgi:hypothetical protein
MENIISGKYAVQLGYNNVILFDTTVMLYILWFSSNLFSIRHVLFCLS